MRESAGMLWVLGICTVELFTMLVFLNYSAVLPLLQVEWRLTSTEAGLIFAAYQIGYIVLVVLLSALTDRVDARIIYIMSALWTGIFGLCFAFFAHDFTSALILRTLTGFGLAGTYMPGMRLVAERCESARRGQAIGLYVASFSLGSALSLSLTGLANAVWGWRTALVLTGLGPVAAAALASGLLWGKTLLQPTAPPSRYSIARGVVANRPALLITIGYAAHNWELFGMRGWIAAFLASSLVVSGTGLTAAVGWGAQLSAVIITIGAFSSALGGWLAGRVGRFPHLVLAMGGGALCSFTIGWIHGASLVVLLGMSFLYGFLVNADSALFSLSITEVATPGYLGGTMALQSFLGFLGAALGPALFGLVLDLTNPPGVLAELGYLPSWGWAFVSLGMGSAAGLLAVTPARHHLVFLSQKRR